MITEEQQSEHVVAYTADINFLLPSIFSAKSIRQFIPKEKLDIFIFLFYEDDLDKFDFTKLKAVLAQDHIFLHITTPHFYTSIDLSIFSKGHVPVASVGRFFLSQLLPEKYEHIVYLDGDTWVSQDPSALFFSKIKDSCVAFANDYAAFEGAIRGNKFKNYWSSIGKDQGQYYFNSGVFAAQRSAWQDVSAKAFAYLQSQSAKCTYHDQSALNATVNANRICLSLRWNFQSNLKQLYLDRDIKPVISHFTRGPKPWEAPIFPWAQEYTLIKNIEKDFAEFNLPLKKVNDQRAESMNKSRLLKTCIFKSQLVRFLFRKISGIDKYENKAAL